MKITSVPALPRRSAKGRNNSGGTTSAVLMRCLRLWWSALGTVGIMLATSCATPGAEEVRPAESIHHSISKDLCAKLDYERIAKRLDAKLLPLDPVDEPYENSKIRCTHGTYGTGKNRGVAIDITVTAFKSSELAMSEFRDRATAASPPTGATVESDGRTYSYIDRDGKAIAGIRDQNLLVEVRLIPTQPPDDKAFTGLLMEMANDFALHVANRALGQ